MVNNIILAAMNWLPTLKGRFSGERGQDFVEYAVLIGAIAIAAFAALLLLPIGNYFTTMGNAIGNCVTFQSSCAKP